MIARDDVKGVSEHDHTKFSMFCADRHLNHSIVSFEHSAALFSTVRDSSIGTNTECIISFAVEDCAHDALIGRCLAKPKALNCC